MQVTYIPQRENSDSREIEKFNAIPKGYTKSHTMHTVKWNTVGVVLQGVHTQRWEISQLYS